MCGFVGAVTIGPIDEGLAQALPAALKALNHRGPDGTGQLIVPHAVFGHARLSIIDLSDAASQPMTAAHGAVTMVFNGEIYNYRELYAQHLAGMQGVNPHSDSSVLLGMYVKYGEAMFKYLCGMFAFAIHDARDASLLIGRDRFGEKPLFYSASERRFVFGSECRAIRKLAGGDIGQIDQTALAHYLHLGSIPAPMSIYSGIRALPPGHYARVALKALAQPATVRYWQLGASVGSAQSPSLNLEEAQSETQRLLSAAVRRCLVADVPVGVFLSGGIDSGAIASLVKSTGGESLRAVTIDFPGTEFSEYGLAATTAARFGVNLTRVPIEASQFESMLAGFFDASDQPTSDGFNTYVVSQAAQKAGGKVWLSGVGGDEIFGGYPFFQRIGRLKRVGNWMQGFPALARASNFAWLPMRLRRAALMASAGDIRARAYSVARAPLPAVEVSRLTGRNWAVDFADGVLLAALPQTADDFQTASSLESGLYMANQLLRDMDNFSMANSIELRAPFLDHDLADFVYSLPQHLKLMGSGAKPLLTASLKLPLPAEVSHGQKRGFTFPLQAWIRGHFAQRFAEVLNDPSLAQWLSVPAMSKLWQSHLAGRTHWSVVWNLYALARWLHANAR